MSGGSKSSTKNTTVVTTDNSNVNFEQDSNTGQIQNISDLSLKDSTFTLTDQGAVKASFDFGNDALDQAFNFGAQALQSNKEFGESVISEAQEISSTALQVAGNAQTNAFKKIREIAESFTNTSSANTTTILLAIAGSVGAMGFIFFIRKGKA
jgi:hypothetical protein